MLCHYYKLKTVFYTFHPNAYQSTIIAHIIYSPSSSTQLTPGIDNLLPVFLVRTLVIACLIVIPAFSISFFVRPVVMQTFSAGWSFQSESLPLLPGPTGMLFKRVIRTLFTRACCLLESPKLRKLKYNYLIHAFL